MRSPWIAPALAAAAVLVAPTSCLAAAGSLDRSFDGNGRLTVKADRPSRPGNAFESTRLQPIAMASAAAPDGELVAANDQRVIRFRAGGRARRYFGGNGRAVIPPPSGTTFRLAGVAVDSRGRVLVAGTISPSGSTGAGSLHSRAAVYRFMPNGKLDASFGSRGLAGARLGPMQATGLAVDLHDRPVLTGLSALTPYSCNAKTPVYLNTTVVARLTAGGAPDPTFGGGSGFFADSLEDPWLPALSGTGRTAYVSATEGRCAGFVGYMGPAPVPLASTLSPGGGLAARFPVRPPEPHGLALEGGLGPTSLAVDRQGRIVILMTATPPEGGDEILQEVRRFLPDGSADPQWRPWVRDITGWGPDQPFQAVTTDRRNRVILAGSSLRGEGAVEARGFAVERLSAAGMAQTSFGRAGLANAWFGEHGNAIATQVFIDSRGRVVLAGTTETLKRYRPSTEYRLAFARFLSG